MGNWKGVFYAKLDIRPMFHRPKMCLKCGDPLRVTTRKGFCRKCSKRGRHFQFKRRNHKKS